MNEVECRSSPQFDRRKQWRWEVLKLIADSVTSFVSTVGCLTAHRFATSFMTWTAILTVKGTVQSGVRTRHYEDEVMTISLF